MSVAELQAEIAILNGQIKNIQDSCDHIHFVSIPGCNTGNYSPSDDCYWTDYMCHTCLLKWRKYHD
jgi:hypothetical protein